MRERALIDAIHRRLPRSLHRQSMTFGAMTQNGTPDYWYDGTRRDLWVEYKQLRSLPRSGIVQLSKLLTPLQAAWIKRRYATGCNVRVMVGLPGKRAIMVENAETASVQEAVTYDEVAKWICDFCGCCCDQAAR